MSKHARMRRNSARRVVQLFAAGAIAASGSMLLLPTSAAADSVKVGLLQQAWYWQNAYEQSNPPVAEAPPATEPSGVPSGDLAVAFTDPGASPPEPSSKMTALSFNLGSLAPGSSVTDFTFSLTLDTDPSATAFNTAGATILACLPTRGWPAVMQGDYTDEPTYTCANGVKPEVNGNTYTFKIPAIAQTWVDDQNLGVAIVADPDKSAAPFQVVFKGAKDVQATLGYTPAVAPPPTTSPPAGGSTGPVSTGNTGTTGSGPSVPLPPVSTGNVGGNAPAPVVASPVPAVAPATTAVAAVKPASSAPTAGFWLAAIAIAAIVLVTSLVLGDPSPAPATAAAGSRLDRVLRERNVDVFTVRSL